MQEQQAHKPNAELVSRMNMSALDEASGVLKLYFTLSTGAVVLFTNLLVQSHVSRFLAIPLALSIFAFGGEAALSLRLLLGLAGYRLILGNAFATGIAVEALQKQVDDWAKRHTKQAKWLERLFWAGMAFAVIFVALIVFVR
jgi:hypothetical protein